MTRKPQRCWCGKRMRRTYPQGDETVNSYVCPHCNRTMIIPTLEVYEHDE